MPPKKDRYRLKRGLLQSTRLNLLDYILYDIMTYRLHPSILISSETNTDVKVADIGTGTAYVFTFKASMHILPLSPTSFVAYSPQERRTNTKASSTWLTKLSTSLPRSARLHGFDISSAQFPSAVHLPSNVRLHVLDVMAPIPDHWQGVFDVVHVRLLQAGVFNDLKSVVGKLAGLLSVSHSIVAWMGSFS